MKRLLALICLTFPLLAPSKAQKGGMDSFRYEYHNEGVSTVYYINRTTEGTSLYYREDGSNEGWRLSSIDNGAINELARLWKRLKLSSLEKTSLDCEDKSRGRWMAEAGFGDGSSHPIIKYLDSPTSEEDLEIKEAVSSCIHSLIEKHKASGRRCVTSKCIYSPDGQFIRRIDHDPDGNVCGGFDAFDPFARF